MRHRVSPLMCLRLLEVGVDIDVESLLKELGAMFSRWSFFGDTTPCRCGVRVEFVRGN